MAREVSEQNGAVRQSPLVQNGLGHSWQDRSPSRFWPSQNGFYDYCVGVWGFGKDMLAKDGRVLYG